LLFVAKNRIVLDVLIAEQTPTISINKRRM